MKFVLLRPWNMCIRKAFLCIRKALFVALFVATPLYPKSTFCSTKQSTPLYPKSKNISKTNEKTTTLPKHHLPKDLWIDIQITLQFGTPNAERPCRPRYDCVRFNRKLGAGNKRKFIFYLLGSRFEPHLSFVWTFFTKFTNNYMIFNRN